MTPEQLKASILQYAIQGKLVEQRPEESTSEELFDKIQEEKQKLIAEKKIKKEKPLPKITEDEKPFDIPDSWKWVRVGQCFANKTGLSYKKDALDIQSDKMVRVLRGGNISNLTMIRGHKCDYKKQIREELLDDAVAEVIVKLVSNPKFAAMMQEKINMKVDTAAIDQEIANYEKQLRQHYSIKSKLAEEIDSLDPDDRHYVRRKADLDDRLYRMYDKIEDTESSLIAARAKKQAIEAEKLTGDNIYKVLIYFEKLYGVMNDVERRQLIEALISEIQIYPERQPNGQWLKSIKFKLPIIEEDMSISLDNEEQVESVVRLERDGSRKTEQGNRASLGAEGEIDFADIALLNAELKQRGLRYHIYYKDEHTACLEPPGACCLTEDLKQNTMQCIREYYEKKHRLVHFFGGDLYFTCGELPAD